MVRSGASARIDKELDCSGQAIVATNLSENAFGQGLNAVARGIEEFRAEIAQTVFDNLHEELILGGPFDSFLQFASAGLMNSARELLGCGAELNPVDRR